MQVPDTTSSKGSGVHVHVYLLAHEQKELSEQKTYAIDFIALGHEDGLVLPIIVLRPQSHETIQNEDHSTSNTLTTDNDAFRASINYRANMK